MNFTSLLTRVRLKATGSAKSITVLTRTVSKRTGGGERVFCNPPYSKIKDWVKKCYEESLKPGTLVAMLIPARTDTKWFHDYILHRSEVRFIKGRLKFGNSKNSAPFPSMIVIFRAAGIE